jgi:phosphate transport system substrate-binding protein
MMNHPAGWKFTLSREGDGAMGRTARWIVFGSVLLAATPGCPSGPGENRHNLVVTGSTEMAPMVRELARAFETAHPGIRINVQATDSEHGLADARQGLADVGMVARALRPDETNVHVFPIARVGFAFCVHKDNPVASLDREQVVGIYSRSLTNWKKVGGSDMPIVTVGMSEGRAASKFFLEHFNLRALQTRPDITAGDTAQVVRAVARRHGAIGYVSVTAAEDLIAGGSPVRLLPWEGVTATAENVAGGSYLLVRSLNLVTRDTPEDPLREFLHYAQSEEAHAVVLEYHFLPPGH